MPMHSHELLYFLVKHYDMSRANAMIMIEEEWDFVEEFLQHNGTVEALAGELIDIYMVA